MIAPSETPSWDDCTTWTGSVVQGPTGRYHLFYTGTTKAEDGMVQRIGRADSDDLVHWERFGDTFLVEADPRWYERYDAAIWHDEAFRDPWVFEDPAGEGPGEDGTTATPEDPASSPTPTPEVNNPSDTKTPSTETVAETSEDATGEDTNRNTRTVPLPEDGGAVVTVKVGGYRTGIDQTAVSGLAGVTLYLYTTDTG